MRGSYFFVVSFVAFGGACGQSDIRPATASSAPQGTPSAATAAAPSSAKSRCAEKCVKLTRATGDDGAFCGGVCDSTCEMRCGDASRRMGGVPCDRICSTTCADLEQTFGMGDELCQWLVNGEPSLTYTPRSLSPELEPEPARDR